MIIDAHGLKYLRLKQCVKLKETQDALNEMEWKWQGSEVRVGQENAIPEEKEGSGALFAMSVSESKEAGFGAASG